MATPPLNPNVIANAHEAVRKYGNVTAAAKALGIPWSTLKGRLRKPAPKLSKAPEIPVAQKCGLSVEDIRRQHDPDIFVPEKIRAAFKALGARCLPDHEFARLAGVSATLLSQYRDAHDFVDHWHMVAGKRFWSGSKKSIEELRVL